MPKLTGKRLSTTPTDRPHKCPECLKTYLQQKDLNRHIRASHDLVKYTCTRCLTSFTRQYNLTEHLLKDCIPKVGSAVITRIQPLSHFLQEYKIPTTTPQVMPRCMNPEEEPSTSSLQVTSPFPSSGEAPRTSTAGASPTPIPMETDPNSQLFTHALFPSTTTTPKVSAFSSPSTPITGTSIHGSLPREHTTLEGYTLAIPEQDDMAMTQMSGLFEPSTLTPPAHIGSTSPPDLEADLALSDSTESDLERSVREEIQQLQREDWRSQGERARTATKTVWPIDCLFSSPEKSQSEESKSQDDVDPQDPPPCEVQESSDQITAILVPYSPSCSSSSSGTPLSPDEDPLRPEDPVPAAINNLMTDFLAIANNKDLLASRKISHALEATHRELTFLLYTEGLGKASPRDT